MAWPCCGSGQVPRLPCQLRTSPYLSGSEPEKPRAWPRPLERVAKGAWPVGLRATEGQCSVAKGRPPSMEGGG